MATVSNVPELKAQLVTRLTARIADDEVLVVYARPADAQVKRRMVYFGDSSFTSAIANIKAGRKQRDHRGTADLVIAVSKPRGTAQEAEEEALTLLEAVEDELADDPTIGDLDGLVHATLGEVRVTPDYSNEGPFCVVVAGVDFFSRLV